MRNAAATYKNISDLGMQPSNTSSTTPATLDTKKQTKKCHEILELMYILRL